jgi:hypothetical protein
LGLITVPQVSDGTTADASDINNPVNIIAAEINGNIDDANIKSAAGIQGTKLADNSLNLGAKASDWDGWIKVSDTWTYASANTVTVPSDATAKYSVGDKVKFSQTSTKYFYITNVTSTVLTLSGGSDYTVANSAISNIYYSKAATPLGFPSWFNFTPNWTSSGTAPAIGNGTFTGQFSVTGKIVFIQLHFVGGSTTTWGSGNYYVDYPVTPATKYNTTSGGWCLSGYVEDLGAVAYSIHSARTNNSTRFQIILFAPQNTTVLGWGATSPFTWGTGDFFMCTGFYEIA